MLYEVKNRTLSLSGNVILSHFFFRMVDGEKIGIVGRNGAGKTSLLRLMNSEIELDYNDDNTIGEIVKSNDYNVAYMKQQLAGAGGDSKTILYDENEKSRSYDTITAYEYLLSAFNKLIEIFRDLINFKDWFIK